MLRECCTNAYKVQRALLDICTCASNMCAAALQDSKDFTAVSMAAFNGSTDIVAMLIRVGR
jgi:hypothetical protein